MATVSAWGKPGAWALESEEQDAVELLQKENSASPQQELSEFPSLSAAAATKSTKKKKGQTLSLSEFTSGQQVTHGSAKTQPRLGGLTTNEILALPTGPRERTQEELERARHGGFRSYGGGPRDSERKGFSGTDESSTTRWSSSRASDEPRRSGGFGRDSTSSRADDVDDWGAAKKISPPALTDRRERGGFFDSHSRADDSESWFLNKSTVNPPEPRRRSGFDMLNRESSNEADMSDSWIRKKESPTAADTSDSWARKKEETGGRPRLVLQPRTLPVDGGEANPTAAKNKGPSPFGNARPREEVLAQKGQDWKKIDEQLESVKIKETVSNETAAWKKAPGVPDDASSWRKGPAVPDDGSSWKKGPAVPDDSSSWKKGPAAPDNASSWKKDPSVPVDPPSWKKDPAVPGDASLWSKHSGSDNEKSNFHDGRVEKTWKKNDPSSSSFAQVVAGKVDGAVPAN